MRDEVQGDQDDTAAEPCFTVIAMLAGITAAATAVLRTTEAGTIAGRFTFFFHPFRLGMAMSPGLERVRLDLLIRFGSKRNLVLFSLSTEADRRLVPSSFLSPAPLFSCGDLTVEVWACAGPL